MSYVYRGSISAGTVSLTSRIDDHVLLSPNVLTAIDWPTLVHVSTQQNEPDLEATENAGVIADSQSANVFRYPMTIPLFNKHTCSLTEDVYKLLAMPSSRFALHGPEHYGKTTLLKTVSRDLGIEVICKSFVQLNQSGDVPAQLDNVFRQAQVKTPSLIILRDYHHTGTSEGGANPNVIDLFPLIRYIRMLKRLAQNLDIHLCITVDILEHLPAELRAHLTSFPALKPPTEAERHATLQQAIQTVTACKLADDGADYRLYASPKIDYQALGKLIPPAPLNTVYQAVAKAARSCVTQHSNASIEPKAAAGIQITHQALAAAFEKTKHAIALQSGLPQIPDVPWEAVGGVSYAKKVVLETIQLPLMRPDLFKGGLRSRSGILLYGPPGTGKTMLAKAIATSCSLNFLSVKGPELLNMYVGESEANIRAVFRQAIEMKPSVVFFDELDSVAPRRGANGDAGGVMDRVVSSLLTEIDALSSGTAEGEQVFIIGATNRPDLLDENLLRSGRFDKFVYMGIPETHSEQHAVIKALVRKYNLSPDVDLEAISTQCPLTSSGADLYALCSNAMHNALLRKVKALKDRLGKNVNASSIEQYLVANSANSSADIVVSVDRSDFVHSLQSMKPSLNETELSKYKELRAKFGGTQ